MEKFSYEEFFSTKLAGLKKDGCYRYFLPLRRIAGHFPRAMADVDGKEKEIIVWCSNDYLGMGQNPSVTGAMEKAIRDFGAGAGGTRNISGTHRLICALEDELAEVTGKEAALAFSSGYVANEAALRALCAGMPDCLVLSDAENHDSMIQGIRNSRANKQVVPHNDPDKLDKILSERKGTNPCLFAFESVYSMNGSMSDLPRYAEVVQKHGIFTFLDETHAVGLYGKSGGGRSDESNTSRNLDVIQGGLGKGFGVVGGFIAASRNCIDFVRSFGNGFIFTTTMPPVVAAGALAAVRHLRHSNVERERLHANVRRLRGALALEGIPMIKSTSHIVAVVVGDPFKVKAMADTLLKDYGLYLQPINHPTVPKGTERFRITPSAVHTADMIDNLVTALSEVWDRFELERSFPKLQETPALNYNKSDYQPVAV